MIFPCEPCQEYWDGWSNFQFESWPATYRGWKHQGPARLSVESYHAKAEERRQLVRQQCDLKADSCRAKGCLEPRSAA